MGWYGKAPSFGAELQSDLDIGGFDISGEGSVIVEGILQGGVKVENHSGATVNLTAAQCYGSIHQGTYAGAQLFNLPAVADGMFVTIKATLAQVLTIDPNAADRIVFEGTAKSDGVTIVSGGDAKAVVTLYADSAAGWTVLGYDGGWA